MVKKDSGFVRWFTAREEEIHIAQLKAPMAFSFINIMIVFFAILSLVSVVVSAYFNSLPLSYEIEGSCNTGFIGLDFSERFVFNETNPEKPLISFNPQKLDVNNIDGLNCNFKVKGAITKDLLLMSLRK